MRAFVNFMMRKYLIMCHILGSLLQVDRNYIRKNIVIYLQYSSNYNISSSVPSIALMYSTS